MKHFSQCLDCRPKVHEETKVQPRIQNVDNKHKFKLHKAKPGQIKYKILNEENIFLSHLYRAS